MFIHIEVANKIVDRSIIPYRGPSSSKPMKQTSNPRPSEKKTVVLQLYVVTGKREGPQSITPGVQTEYIVLAKNNSEAKKTIKTQYGDSILTCTVIPGPFKNGTVLMRKES